MEEKKIEFVESDEDFYCPYCGVKLEKILFKKAGESGGIFGKSMYVSACPGCKKLLSCSFTDFS